MIKKRGLSGVVSVVIIIAVVMAAGVLVWNFVENMISERIEETEACREARDKVSLDNDFTCYNHLDKKVRFKVDVGDIELDAVSVTITSEGKSESYELTSTAREYSDITNYPSEEGAVKVPGKNKGETFIVENFELDVEEDEETTLRIEIAPMIDDKQCNTVDSIKNVYRCSSFN